MGAMPWLSCLGKLSNEALLRVGHGLRAGHVTKASLPREAWWPQSVFGGAWLRHQDMLMSCKTLGKRESDKDIII